jgi:hypothetical protein
MGEKPEGTGLYQENVARVFSGINMFFSQSHIAFRKHKKHATHVTINLIISLQQEPTNG